MFSAGLNGILLEVGIAISYPFSCLPNPRKDSPMKNGLRAYGFFLIVMVSFVLPALADPAPVAKDIPEKMPWTLREHYTFCGEALRLDYAKDNAEWRIKIFQEDSETSRMNPNLVLRGVNFSIDINNGPVLTNEVLGQAGETTMLREPYTCDVLGEGTTYAVQFAPHEGLTVQHSMITMRRWNFIRLVIKITNQSDAPVEIRKISPIIIPSDSFPSLTENAAISTSALSFEDGKPVLTGAGPVNSVRLHDPARQVSLLIGFLPSTQASCEFKKYPTGSPLEGIFECTYSSPAVIPAGGTLETDPVSIGYGIDPEIMDAQYLYLLQNFSTPKSGK
jgi:hypothetical protein